MEKITWANAESIEVVIVRSSKKKYYMLARYGSGAMENNFILLSDSTGKPYMWTRKEDMIEYAKKKHLYLVPGYHSIGSRTMGNNPPWM